MWVSLEQMETSHHHLLKTIPRSLLTALLPKVKPMASRMKGSSMSRYLLSKEDSQRTFTDTGQHGKPKRLSKP